MIPERVKLAAAILLTGPPKPKPVVPHQGSRMWGEMPSENPLTEELAAAQHRSAALSLMDEEVYGYLLVTIRKEFHGPGLDVRVLSDVAREFWPAVNETLRRVVKAARDVHVD